MSNITKALEQTRSYCNTVRDVALERFKATGSLDIAGLSAAGGALGQFQNYKEQGANRRRYATFRGWAGAAINAIASKGAAQPAVIGRLGGKGKPKGKKAAVAHRTMPANTRRKAADQEYEILPDHPLLKALEKPNEIQHRWQFVYTYIANLCLTGKAYVIGEVVEGELRAYSLPTTWVTRVVRDDGTYYYEIRNPRKGEAQKEIVEAENVVCSYLPDPSDLGAALAPTALQQQAIKVDDNIQSSQVLFFDNAVFPNAIVTMGANPHPDVPAGVRPRLTGAQRRQIYGAIGKVMAGVANYGRPAIVDGLIESIERLTADQNEIGWEKSEKTVRTRILSAFGVHPFILGEEMAGSYAQAYIVQDLFCARVNIYLDMLSTAMTTLAENLLEEEGLLVWWEEAVAKDPQMEQQKWAAARTNNDVTQNEYRTEVLGLPPDEDHNEQVLPVTSAPHVVALASGVKGGTVDREQAIAILKAWGVPDKIAEDIAGEGPTEEELAAKQAQQMAALAPKPPPGGQQPTQGKPPAGEGKQPPKPVATQQEATAALEKAMGLLSADPVATADYIAAFTDALVA